MLSRLDTSELVACAQDSELLEFDMSCVPLDPRDISLRTC
jgi:hypothetical protein